uniref:Uncharacterized protein n=1 Tax=Panagrolaimus davidi TaxID=227884 RepID=A0A914PB33_9BILA
MTFIKFLLFLIFGVVFTFASPFENLRTYSIATGRGSILRPGFDDSLSNFVKRADTNNNDAVDTEEENQEDFLNYEKRSIALGRSLFRPAKRSMAMGRSGFRPGKRSIATGRAGFRPGKRSTMPNMALNNAQKLLSLQQILEDEIATNQKFLKQFSNL